MPPSQLKQLKASLREHGLVGPQKSKKQRKATSKDAQKRIQRHAALEDIRERFNPFEVKNPARKEKFEVISNKVTKSGPGRPGVTRGLGEERRRETLLKEIQSRNKVGGILDRRFGENDPSMTPEQRAAERFARQSQKKSKKNSIFNLEEEEEEGVQLTHAGQSLSFDDATVVDDFNEDVEGPSDRSDMEGTDVRPRKRLRLSEVDFLHGEDEDVPQPMLPERKKSKQEVMKEVIAKSKLYKYERQQAREDDDTLRAELNNDMSDFYDALRNSSLPAKRLPTPPNTDSEPTMNPERAALLSGKDRLAVEKEYNERVRQMALDKRSKPSNRTKSADELAAEEAERLQELEKKRIQRMKGEEESSDEEQVTAPEEILDDEHDDAEFFGLSQPPVVPPRNDLDVEDEDEFVYDDNLIASDSEAEIASGSGEESETEEFAEDEGEDDFINGLVLPANTLEHDAKPPRSARDLAFTYPCPQSHQELLEVTAGTKVNDLPTIVQRIRALYHPRLAESNKTKLEKFAAVLIEHMAYLANQTSQPPFQVLENLIRHVHSMAKLKSQPEAVGSAFRAHLREIADQRPLELSPGDLVILTGISTIFPTSDHFHAVATPALLTITRYLGQSSVQSLQDLGRGTYCCTLALQYEKFSKRFVPEVITYITNAIAILGPVPLSDKVTTSPKWTAPIRLPASSLRIKEHPKDITTSMSFKTLAYGSPDTNSLEQALLSTLVKLLNHAAELWQAKSAFFEIFESPVVALDHLLSKQSSMYLHPSNRQAFETARKEIELLRLKSREERKPLFLHNHRPLAIKMSIPKFEESFNPDRHYDPDRERADLNKLKAEHKRERKGAMRELRKDANFIARESLREKKEKDAAYEKKFKRLVAEIQGEEGREGKEYEKEKLKRKGRW